MDPTDKPKRQISEATRQKNNERARQWRLAHPDQAKAGVRAWIDKNREYKQKTDREYHAAHREKQNQYRKAWREANPERSKEGQRRWYRENPEKVFEQNLRKYGVDPAWYQAQLTAQGGGCSICGATESVGARKALHVDHDHATGAIRGLLCHHCNTMLGLAKDSPEILAKAIEYLARHRQAAEAPAA